MNEKPKGDVYLVFSLDHDEEKAKETFTERYGYEPDEVTRDNNYLWLGPVRKTEEAEHGDH